MKPAAKEYSCSRCAKRGTDTVKCLHCKRNFCPHDYDKHIANLCEHIYDLTSTVGKIVLTILGLFEEGISVKTHSLDPAARPAKKGKRK